MPIPWTGMALLILFPSWSGTNADHNVCKFTQKNHIVQHLHILFGETCMEDTYKEFYATKHLALWIFNMKRQITHTIVYCSKRGCAKILTHPRLLLIIFELYT